MKKILALGTLAAGLLGAGAAFPCGGGFGEGITINQDQKIVIAHQNGVETYFFSPHFCGKSADFGLILPVPAQLASSPTLGDTNTVSELEDLTKPTVIVERTCRNDKSGGGDGLGSYGEGGGSGVGNQGVDVIDRGHVGMFDWTLLKADTAASFTDWLDAGHYPHAAGADAVFEKYVAEGWYFVAFKITADTQAPPAGMELCGDLGPLTLSFPAAKPVIPARIAGATSSDGSSLQDWGAFTWRVFLMASGEGTATIPSGYSERRYSGAISKSDLGSHPAVAKLASAGQRLTELDITFYAADLQSELTLDFAATATDYRRTEYQEIEEDCAGCSASPGGRVPWETGLATGLLGLAWVARRWRRRS